MKLLVMGVGDCGSRIAGFFSDLNRKARAERHVQIVTSAYAVNNKRDELLSLARRAEFRELQTVFVNRTFDGSKASAVAGAELMRVEGGRVLTAIKPGDFYDTDAIFLITGTAGSFGSGGVPVLIQMLKDRHVGKPIYVLAVLPFETEIAEQQTIINTAICLKSLQKTADAVFLFNNEKFRLQGNVASLQDKKNMENINKSMVLPFYDLLCATETLDPKMAGALSLGIGDILQTLNGWTAIGVGQTAFPTSRTMWRSTTNFQDKGAENQKAMEAMNLAMGRLSIDFKLEDVGKALYLLTVPAENANVDMVKVLGARLREMTNDALIRGGDFYGARDQALVTLVFANLNFVENIKNFYERAVSTTKST